MANKKHKNKRPPQVDESMQNYHEAVSAVYSHPIFSPLMYRVSTTRLEQENKCPREGWGLVTSNGMIYLNPKRYADKDEWVYILTHCLLHLGFGHVKQRENQVAWNAACDVYVSRFLQDLKFGRPPEGMGARVEGYPRDEENIYRRFIEEGIPEECRSFGLGENDMLIEDKQHSIWWYNKEVTWEELFGLGLSNAVARAVDFAGGAVESMSIYTNDPRSTSQKARSWFMSSFPLLGALAAGFKIIEDPLICQRLQISVAAVDAEARELYMNPAAGLDEEECRFVMAHELLHVALRHHARRQGRDPYYWNIACDYVINQWLIEMGIGHMPPFGLLYDPELKGMNAEAIYDVIVTNLRKYRKLATLRGYGACDMLEPKEREWWKHGEGLTLDEFYRRALAQGLQYHQQEGRGTIPAGLIEEILAQSQPPIAWDVELAHWFDEHFPPVEKVRTYARPSRRQSSTPDIPRPRYVTDWRYLEGRTFGVVLDTSGSMPRELLAKALGAIASYSLAHEVPAVRVVFCDAYPYDQGYMSPEDIAGRVKVRGRGGTVLQPGIHLLEKAEDFPDEGPILIITDTYCEDRLLVRRDHAYLVPDGKQLPFPARGPVFYVR